MPSRGAGRGRGRCGVCNCKGRSLTAKTSGVRFSPRQGNWLRESKPQNKNPVASLAFCFQSNAQSQVAPLTPQKLSPSQIFSAP